MVDVIITGVVAIDLTAVRADRQHNRVHAALADAPKGVAVELVIGPLRVDPAAVRLLREYAEERQFAVTVKGEHGAVQRWVSAIRSGETFGLLL